MTPEQLYDEYVTALKSHNATRLAVVKAVRQEVHDREIASHTKADEACVEAALRRVERTTREERDTRAAALGKDEERVTMLSEQLEWLESALPAQMDADELETLVDEAMAAIGCDSMRQMRDVIAHVRENATAAVDNGAISALVRAKLTKGGR